MRPRPFLTKKEMLAIEDQFFCETSKKEYAKRRPVLLSAWKKLCKIHDD